MIYICSFFRSLSFVLFLACFILSNLTIVSCRDWLLSIPHIMILIKHERMYEIKSDYFECLLTYSMVEFIESDNMCIIRRMRNERWKKNVPYEWIWCKKTSCENQSSISIRKKESIFYFIFENPFVVICHRTKLIRSIFDRIMSTHSANGWWEKKKKLEKVTQWKINA